MRGGSTGGPTAAVTTRDEALIVRLDGVLPGSSCIANADTSNHDLIASNDIGSVKKVILHAVDTVGIVHAMILHIEALVLPIQILVFTGH
jgi:hypothetical protein